MLRKPEAMPHNANFEDWSDHEPLFRKKDSAIILITLMTLAAVILAVYVTVYNVAH